MALALQVLNHVLINARRRSVSIKQVYRTKVMYELPMQPISKEVYSTKYQLKDFEGDWIDVGVAATQERVANALANVEDNPDEWYPKFLNALRNGAIPAGRIMSNAGAEEYKQDTSLINCSVSKSIIDSMSGILSTLYDAGLILKAGIGIGYNFSPLRPKGALVGGVGAKTSGPLSFIDVYDSLCATISSAGGRRGAQMATMDVRHPDILDYIVAKQEDGKFRHFNFSVLITDDFLEAIERDQEWELAFPASNRDRQNEDDNKFIWCKWRSLESSTGYLVDEDGDVYCKVYNTIRAVDLWHQITDSTYDYSEPGIIFIDKYNLMNNLWFCETILSTNPCGEQGLPSEGSCLLGSINLTKFVIEPFTDNSKFDWEKFEEVVAVSTRMLDNVVEISGLPLPGQQREIQEKRRHGMGFTGLGSALIMLGIKYGSDKALVFTKDVSYILAVVGWETGVELAKEKGCAPILNETFEVTSEMLKYNSRLEKDGFSVGDKLKGNILLSYSNYMEKLFATERGAELKKEIVISGCRFTHHSSIAPTGTVSIAFANNVSTGIEPVYEFESIRNLTVEGKKTRQQHIVYSYELLLYRELIDSEASAEKGLPEVFVTANDVPVEQHIKMQGAAQQWIDSSISKTINVPTDISKEDFKHVYDLALQYDLKGCTTFRFNPEVFTGVLIKPDDLKNTIYRFTLKTGDVVEVKGSDTVVYEGEQHNAAMLFDAIKEGRYEQGY